MIPHELRESTSLTIISAPGDHPKALSINWSTDSDVLLCCCSKRLPQQEGHQSESVTAKMFDMLWFSPALLPAKLLLQSLWPLKISWDQLILDETRKLWSTQLEQIHFIAEHPIPRKFWIKDHSEVSVQLHDFADASAKAYGGVLYKCFIHDNINASVFLLTSKCKLSPLKELTIPRLELCAALTLPQPQPSA